MWQSRQNNRPLQKRCHACSCPSSTTKLVSCATAGGGACGEPPGVALPIMVETIDPHQLTKDQIDISKYPWVTTPGVLGLLKQQLTYASDDQFHGRVCQCGIRVVHGAEVETTWAMQTYDCQRSDRTIILQHLGSAHQLNCPKREVPNRAKLGL